MDVVEAASTLPSCVVGWGWMRAEPCTTLPLRQACHPLSSQLHSPLSSQPPLLLPPPLATVAGCGGADHWQLEPENYEGWRVRVAEAEGKEGWILLRPSLHDPGALLAHSVRLPLTWRVTGWRPAPAAPAQLHPPRRLLQKLW